MRRRAAFWMNGCVTNTNTCDRLIRKEKYKLGVAVSVQDLMKGEKDPYSVPIVRLHEADDIYVPDIKTDEELEFLRENGFDIFLLAKPDMVRFLKLSEDYDHIIPVKAGYLKKIEKCMNRPL